MLNYLPPKSLQFEEYLTELYPGYINGVADIKTLTFQVTENCCLNCSYCYQKHTTNKDMKFETIQPFLDKLLTDNFEAISTKNTKGLIWEFIGGEPFMQIDLIEQITDYVFEYMIRNNHPWLFYSRIAFSSNGILYSTEKVQSYLNKYEGFISLGISIDGNKQLHDTCRVDLTGQGSYDRVISAIRQYKSTHNGHPPQAKLTFAHENIPYLYDAFISLIDEGYTELPGNCVYEDVWDDNDPAILYNQLKKLADYIIDNDLYDKIHITFFEEDFFQPMDEKDDRNWCGGVGSFMYAVDYEGNLYHCIRYMESSLQGEQDPLIIGDIEHGVGKLPQHAKNEELTNNVTRRSQSTDECFYCPVAQGCAWCSGFNYQKTGSVNKRVTYICKMHKARGLANVYYWNKLYHKLNIQKSKHNYLPTTDCLKIISTSELQLLKQMEESNYGM